MTERVFDELLARWDAIVAKLTELSPKMFGLYVRQAVLVDGVVTVLVSTAVICVAWWLLPRAVACFERAVAEPAVEDADIGWAAAVAGLLVAGCFAFGFFISGMAHVLNPEYYAFRALIGTFVK